MLVSRINMWELGLAVSGPNLSIGCTSENRFVVTMNRNQKIIPVAEKLCPKRIALPGRPVR